jgi:predicted acyl esterase
MKIKWTGYKSETVYDGLCKDGMIIEWNTPITMDDGTVLRANVFRPLKDGKYPVIMSMWPYGKDRSYHGDKHFTGNRPYVCEIKEEMEGSSTKYMTFEVPDPERWVPHGYACVRVDPRGAGCSPGYLDFRSPREIRDYYLCIEWAGTQPWSNGKVGLSGVSYPAWNQWLVAALQPPHLAAMIPWEGSVDWYRDWTHQGGILYSGWYPGPRDNSHILQYGAGICATETSRWGPTQSGYYPESFSDPPEPAFGPEILSDEELYRNRIDLQAAFKAHPFDDSYYKERSADLSKVTVPFLSAANWGLHCHMRGNFEGYMRAASKQKWLEVHGGPHGNLYYYRYGVNYHKRFFDHFLKGIDNDWKDQPPVQLNLRKIDGTYVQRAENEWPIARTQWTRFYLNTAAHSLDSKTVDIEGSIEYDALGMGVTFMMPPLEQETEITGPAAAKLFVSSSTPDADLFLIIRLFDPDGKEVTFGSTPFVVGGGLGAPFDPHTPIAQGWLRASHRKLDPQLSTEYRPYHTHDTFQPLEPGEVYELDVEIWPTSVIVPPGYRIALTVKGKEYIWSGYEALDELGNGFELTTVRTGANMRHNVPWDRPISVFGGKTTLYAGGNRATHLVIPIIPKK